MKNSLVRKILAQMEATIFSRGMTRIHTTWNLTFLLKCGVVLVCGLCLHGLLLFPGIGMADGRKNPTLKEDLSYFNHFAAAELTVELQEGLEVELGVDFEHNVWTTGIVDDERKGAA